MNLPRDEMAFRKQYQGLVLQRKLTTIFRPGNRIYPNWRGYKPGEVVTLRVIEKVGDDAKKIPPTFNDIKLKIKIAEIQVKNIEELSQKDFIGSSEDVQDITSLKQHLSHIYRKPISSYHKQLVTQITIAYLE
ncbi:hypothetical protein [Candidatus Uabimicrobium amorphum]|uniref:ASCH domain-containing protein n=1 Tax=Uabimicrobium amorphum TaxID=2596890 RepID=A0A5S9IUL3_UABAM|nr:hypothetical protein [Candidatus Uabimicrobium amorphum]BBM87801.1 hypothetical protein UABAM_06216 [Candidatus Uabimicrobium amorphum]